MNAENEKPDTHTSGMRKIGEMSEHDLVEFIVTDLKRNGPIAHAVEIYVLPRSRFFRSLHESQ